MTITIRSTNFSDLIYSMIAGLLIGTAAFLAFRVARKSSPLWPVWAFAAFCAFIPPLVTAVGGSHVIAAEAGMPILLLLGWGTFGIAAGLTVARYYSRQFNKGRLIPVAIVAVAGALGGIAVPFEAADRVSAPVETWATMSYVLCDGSRMNFDEEASVTLRVDDRYPQTLKLVDGRVDYEIPYYWTEYSMDLRIGGQVVRQEHWKQYPGPLYLDVLARVGTLGLAESRLGGQEGAWEFRESGC
ncbi:hypothetical protein [Agreia bicolorata]|nr:hypothetical protein [Agreia bicolorata]